MTLPKPYYQDDSCTIYHADCRDILLEIQTVDSLITDPPFGIGFDYGEKGHDDSFESYEQLLLPVIKWGKENAKCCLFWQAMKNCRFWHKWFPEDYRILAACKGFVQFRPTGIQYSWDPIIAFGKFDNDPNVSLKDFHIQKLAPFGCGRERIDHPCPRPFEQVNYFIQLTSGTLVLDPFMGSGTTLRAAKDLGRKAIGIELEEKYCEIAAKRLAQEVLFK
jgi:site-specific DNA-methyltransferase (adenine-specific)